VNLNEIVGATSGWTGADLELTCKKAAILALEESRGKSSEAFRVGRRHLQEALAQTRVMKS